MTDVDTSPSTSQPRSMPFRCVIRGGGWRRSSSSSWWRCSSTGRPPTRPTDGTSSRSTSSTSGSMFGVWNTLQLTIYSMVLAIVLGVILAVMRLSPNPVFRSVSWVYLWIFRGTPIYVQLVFWGLIPTIYANIQLGVPFGPSFFHLNLQALSIPFLAGDPRAGAQRGRLHGRNHPRRNQFRAGGPARRRRRRWACRGGWRCAARCSRRRCG